MLPTQSALWRATLTCCASALLATAAPPPPPAYNGWPAYLGGPENLHYSSLRQIHTGNVRSLRQAWIYDTGDAFQGSEMQTNPIVVGGTLFTTTPKLRLIALDAATGKLKWAFDPNAGKPVTSMQRNRGVVYARGRLYFAAAHWLYAIDAETGQPVAQFGNGAGRIDLRTGLGRDPETLTVGATTPGVVYRDLLILGSIVGESLPSAPGDIRAFDLATGAQRWSFHTIPHPGEFGYETWPAGGWQFLGGANNWCGMALDEKRGIVYVPTGSAAFDFYGSNRPGDNLFANTILALRAATGERVWHFQTVRHDVWDRDFPSPPTLVTVRRAGKPVDAVAQPTKSGHVWLLDRDTGKPLFPVDERAVPPSDVEGEALAPKQILPSAPPPVARQRFTEAMITRRTPEAHAAVLERFRTLRSGDQFTPPSREGTVVFPGFDGGAEWGGAAFDPTTRLLYINSNEMPWVLRLVPRRDTQTARGLYNRHCSGCHREDLRGTPPEFPTLVDVAKHRTEAQIAEVMAKGAGRMPGFASVMNADARAAVLRLLITGGDSPVKPGAEPEHPALRQKYGIDGYNKFLDPDGYPAVEPPWGTLNAIDLERGRIAWSIPFGEIPALVKQGIRNTGSENYGGAVVTAGGLLFIGATNHDRKFRAFDKRTGKLLWETELPASGNATPAVYEVNGRQFVVIGAGGGKSGSPSGGSYVAFALPSK